MTALIGLACLGVAFVWPLVSALIRYWAHYGPKQIVLGDEECRRSEGVPIEGPNDGSNGVRSYLSLLLRIKRIEGRKGLWKGLGMLMGYSLSFVILLALYKSFLLMLTVTKCPFFRLLPFVLLIAVYIVIIPIRVFLIRTVAGKAPTESAQAHKSLVLNHQEEEIPLRLCLLPGVAASFIIFDLGYLSLSCLRSWILRWEGYPSLFPEVIAVSFIANLIIGLAATPLSVITVRLALQEYKPADPPSPIISTDVPLMSPPNLNEGVDPPPSYEDSEGIDSTTPVEDVITLREGYEPYKGLIDCAWKVVREEGFTTLWRGWWILVGLFFLKDILLAIVHVPTILRRL